MSKAEMIHIFLHMNEAISITEQIISSPNVSLMCFKRHSLQINNKALFKNTDDHDSFQSKEQGLMTSDGSDYV